RVSICALVCVVGLGAGCALGRADEPDSSQSQGQDQGHDRGLDPILSDPMGGQATPTKISGTLGELFKQIDELDPIRRAGLKASVLRRVGTVLPMVVVVDDAPGYLHAIANWEGGVRFPVLWDDGSVESREHIARFVRAFEPKEVVKLSYAKENDPGGAFGGWNRDRAHRRELIELALSHAVDSKALDWKKSIDQLAREGIVSPGLVVSDAMDSSWAAALALSAGRLQPMVFVEGYGKVHQPLSAEDADALEREIERAAAATGRSWKGIGDEIDAITLALNTGTMIKTGSGARDRLATTDRIGRMEHNGSGERWAYCGQIIGHESRSVYQAMCALFLEIDQGFVWDGYGHDRPWGQYDGTEAGEVLEEAKIKTEVHDEPRNALSDWKLRMVRAVGEDGSAGVMLMNSKGASNYFDLPGVPGGLGKPGYLPMLEVPMALHIVHSFSLQRPMSRYTVGGRLLERGVFVYAGSVDEPMLGAFVPTPMIARRLAGSLSFASAVRYDDGKVWKVTVLGDPLVTVGSAGVRLKKPISIPGGQVLGTRYKDRLRGKDYAGAISDLVMLGRDDDVARIGKALLKEKPAAFDSEVALAAIPAFFRVGEYGVMLDAYERLDGDGQVDGLMQDVLWLSTPYLLAKTAGDDSARSRVQALMRANLRKWQEIFDAETLAMSMRSRSMADAVGVLEALRPTLNENQRVQLDRAIQRVRR
ncbi:MAG: hypothetical protein ACWA5W_01875, partial [Phycisphaerales bacterium]